MPKSKPAPTRRPKDPNALLLRGAIAILILAALAIGLNLLQQVLFPPVSATPTPAAMLLVPAARAGLPAPSQFSVPAGWMNPGNLCGGADA